jgi:hypothetical protein
MLIDVKNENYGYSVTTHNDWVVVGNPSSFRYDVSSASYWRTGSIDIFKYNTLTDKHDLMLTVYKPAGSADELILSEDTSSNFIHTDIHNSFWMPIVSVVNGNIIWNYVSDFDRPLRIDSNQYLETFEDDYGHSVDVYNDVLAVGSRWHNQKASVTGKTFYITGSSVDIYNLSALYSSTLDGYIATGSSFLANVISPPSGSEPISGSFGFSVSLNSEWLAIGSPSYNTNNGAVYIYRKNDLGNRDNFDWTFFTVLTGSSTTVGDYFGHAIDLNKQTGSYSGSLIVGCGNKTFAGSKAYYFEFNGVNWKEKFTFSADRNLYKLPFYDVNPIIRCDDYSVDGFGNSVALYENDIAIGAPTDRWIYEYSGSRAYKQGSCYILTRCSDSTKGWNLCHKFYGNEKTIKNNKLGFSVDLWDGKLVIGCPKSNVESMSSCYLQGSIWQQNYCYSDLENYIDGQWVMLQKNTSSSSPTWDVLNVYQRKKRFLSPYRSLGYDVAIADKSVVIGSPMIINDSNRSFNINNTGSIQGNTVLELDDICGKSYIYNLTNFRENFHVGNVFYRNGKIVLNTSGSVFEGMWFNPVNENNYEYEIHFDGKQTIYEKQIICTVEPGEFNVSTNPTALVNRSIEFDINGNGRFDWQDMDVILQYMQRLNSKSLGTGISVDWTSSLLRKDDEISLYNYYSSNIPYYNTGSDFISQSFYKINNSIGNSSFDFNQDSQIDLNDMNIFWKYCSNRLTQTNYQSYITPNSNRKLFSDIIDHLDVKTDKNGAPEIKPDFLTYASKSSADPTGSYLSPYVTTIGLYNGLDLIAVAKLGSPIKLTGDFPLNFMIKMDF